MAKDEHTYPLFQDATYKRANDTIGFEITRGRLTLVTKRLLHFFLFCVNRDGVQDIYSRPLGEVQSFIAYNSHNVSELKERLAEMQAVQVRWNGEDEKERRWGVGSMISRVEIVQDKRTNWTMVEWKLDERIRSKVVEATYFTELTLRIHTELSSLASVSLYEICARYQNNPSSLTHQAPWRWWCAQLRGVSEAEVGEHEEFKYFNREVLKKAIAEVNELSDIEIEPKIHKKGKWVDKLQFIVSKKKKTPTFIGVDADPLLSTMVTLPMSANDAREILSSYQPDYIRRTLEFVNARIRDPKLPKVASKAAYFKGALKNGYADQAKATEVNVASPRVELVTDSPESRMARARAAITTERIKDAQGRYENFAPEDQDAALLDFKSQTSIAAYKRADTLKRGAMKTAFFEWLAERILGPIRE